MNFIELDELKLEDPKYIASLKSEMKYCSNTEQSAKLALNSMYGAMGNQYFHFCNFDVAESITAEGQAAIKITEKIVNNFFLNEINKYPKILEFLGVEELNLTRPPVIYIDTDSNYYTLEEIIEKTGYNGSVIELCEYVYNNGLNEWIENEIQAYLDSRNYVENQLVFELETISSVGLWLAKKQYMLDMVWKDGETLSKKKTYVKGIDIVRSDTPTYCREQLLKVVEYVLEAGKGFKDKEHDFVLRFMRGIKEGFKMSNYDNISRPIGIKNYQKYVLQDSEEIMFASKAPAQVKGAAYHNYLIKEYNLTHKYNRIKNGDKVKYYVTNNPEIPVFAYMSGSFPIELKQYVEMDYDLQFEKTILSLTNRILTAVGLTPLNADLIYELKLF